jgi:hypothetical protein
MLSYLVVKVNSFLSKMGNIRLVADHAQENLKRCNIVS